MTTNDTPGPPPGDAPLSGDAPPPAGEPDPTAALAALPTTDGPAPPGRGGPRLRLRLREPGDLVAAVPHLVGYRPVDSLVLMALVPGTWRGEPGPPRQQLGAVLRIDLPDPDDVPATVARCARRMGRAAPEEVALVVVGGGVAGSGTDGVGAGGGSGPPRRDVAEGVEQMFAALRVPVRTRLWVPRIASGETWRCYPPCTCRGTVGMLEDSEMAVASALFGQVTYPSRAEMEASLAPDPAAGTARRRDLVERAHEAAVLDRELGGPSAARRDLDAVRAALAEVTAGRPLGDAELARLAVALTDPRVRDTCFGWALGERSVAAERLWTVLVRGVPEPEVAEPAVLLACSVLMRGGGALVGAALERARHADPDHTLTRLVEGLLEQGIGQEEFRSWAQRSSEDAAATLAA